MLFIAVPAVEFGGVSLLHYLRQRDPQYLENPVRRALFTAGHAHAGVLVILALIGMRYVDAADLSSNAKSTARWSLTLVPIRMPLGFFLAIAAPRATRPNRLITLRLSRWRLPGRRGRHPRHRPPARKLGRRSVTGRGGRHAGHQSGLRWRSPMMVESRS
jgi:hypothetical protein